MYTPLSDQSWRYRTMGYWFATGHWFAQDRNQWTPDFSTDFGDYCARRRDAYDTGTVTSLPSVPDLWTQYVTELDASRSLGAELIYDTDPTPPHGTERPA